METRIYLDFDRQNEIGKFIHDNELYEYNQFYYGILNVSNIIKIVPRIGESFIIQYGDGDYQNELINKIKSIVKREISYLFVNDRYTVKDITHSFGINSETKEDIHFINILLL